MENNNSIVIFDLDDTLYKEIDFLKSAYHEIAFIVAERGGVGDIYEQMLSLYIEKQDVFQYVEEKTKGQINKEELLRLYRCHVPNICLNGDTKKCLNMLHDSGILLGIITDGRSLTQRNKIRALGLEQWILDENILISEEFGFEKPSQENFLYFERKYPNMRYFYVGNSPIKDFKGANELGWTTICLLNSGDEIHTQDFQLDSIFLPKLKVRRLSDICNII